MNRFWGCVILLIALGVARHAESAVTGACYVSTNDTDPYSPTDPTQNPSVRFRVTLNLEFFFPMSVVRDLSQYVPGGVTDYQLFARFVFSHFTFSEGNSAASKINIPYRSHESCGDICVYAINRTSASGERIGFIIRVASPFWSTITGYTVTYTPPPLPSPMHLRVDNSTNQELLGFGNYTEWSCYSFSAVSSRLTPLTTPYITSFMMTYDSSAVVYVPVVTFSTTFISPCPDGSAAITIGLFPAPEDVSRYGQEPYRCTNAITAPYTMTSTSNANRNQTLMFTQCNSLNLQGAGNRNNYLFYSATVTGLCNSIFSTPRPYGLTFRYGSRPGYRRSFLPQNLIFQTSSTADISEEDWSDPLRYQLTLPPSRSNSYSVLVRPPVPLVRSSILGAGIGIGTDVASSFTLSVDPMRFGSVAPASGPTFFGVTIPAFTARVPKVDALVSIPIKSMPVYAGGIYGTLSDAVFKIASAVQFPIAPPAFANGPYPSFTAFSPLTIIPNYQMIETVENTATVFNRGVLEIVKNGAVLNLKTYDPYGANVEHYFMSTYAITGAQGSGPSNRISPRALDADTARLNPYVDFGMPVYAVSVPIRTFSVAPTKAIFSSVFINGGITQTVRVLFDNSAYSWQNSTLLLSRINVTCDGSVRQIGSGFASGTVLQLERFGICGDDPVTVSVGVDAVEASSGPFFTNPDPYVAETILTAELSNWIVTTASVISIVNRAQVVLLFDQSIASVNVTGIELLCGVSDPTVAVLVYLPNAQTGIVTLNISSNCADTNNTLLTIRKYAISFNPTSIGTSVYMAATIYQVRPVSLSGAIVGTPFCSGTSVQIPVDMSDQAAAQVPVTYRVICGTTTVFSQSGFAITGIQSFDLGSLYSAGCNFTITYGVVGLIPFRLPIYPCPRSPILPTEAQYEPGEQAFYLRYGTNLTILASSIQRSKFNVSCTGSTPTVTSVAVANPTLVDSDLYPAKGPVLIISVSGCASATNSNISVSQGAFQFTNGDIINSSNSSNIPDTTVSYVSQECEFLPSDPTVSVNRIYINGSFIPDGFVLNPDGCEHVIPASLTTEQAVFSIKTYQGYICSSMGVMRVRFKRQRLFKFSYGHCDDFDLIMMRPLFGTVLTGSIGGQAYNTEYGKLDTGGIKWITSLLGYPDSPESIYNNVTLRRSTLGGISDSVYPAGLNQTFRCGPFGAPRALIYTPKTQISVDPNRYSDTSQLFNWTMEFTVDLRLIATAPTEWLTDRPSGLSLPMVVDANYLDQEYWLFGCGYNDPACILPPWSHPRGPSKVFGISMLTDQDISSNSIYKNNGLEVYVEMAAGLYATDVDLRTGTKNSSNTALFLFLIPSANPVVAVTIVFNLAGDLKKLGVFQFVLSHSCSRVSYVGGQIPLTGEGCSLTVITNDKKGTSLVPSMIRSGYHFVDYPSPCYPSATCVTVRDGTVIPTNDAPLVPFCPNAPGQLDTLAIAPTRFVLAGSVQTSIHRGFTDIADRSCMDLNAQIIHMTASFYDRVLSPAEIDVLVSYQPRGRKPSTTYVPVVQNAPIYANIEYDLTTVTKAYYQPYHLYLLNETTQTVYDSNMLAPAYVATNGKSATSLQFLSAARTIPVQRVLLRISLSHRDEDTGLSVSDGVFDDEVLVTIIPHEPPPTILQSSIRLPMYKPVSISQNLVAGQFSGSTANRIASFSVDELPLVALAFSRTNGVTTPILSAPTTIDPNSTDVFVRWVIDPAFDPSYYSTFAIIDPVIISAYDNATNFRYNIGPYAQDLLLVSAIEPVVIPILVAVEDVNFLFSLPPTTEYLLTGDLVTLSIIVITKFPQHGKLYSVINATDSSPVLLPPGLPSNTEAIINVSSTLLLYTPDPDYDEFDEVVYAYSGSLYRGNITNVNISVTPIYDPPRYSSAPAVANITVSDPIVYPLVNITFDDPDTRFSDSGYFRNGADNYYSADIFIDQGAIFFNKSVGENMATRSAQFTNGIPHNSIFVLRGDPNGGLGPRLNVRFYNNITAIRELISCIRIWCSGVYKATLSVAIYDEIADVSTGFRLQFTRYIDCQVASQTNADDPDSPGGPTDPPGGSPVDPFGDQLVNLGLLAGLIVLAVGIAIMVCIARVADTVTTARKLFGLSKKAVAAARQGDIRELATVAKDAAQEAKHL